jgi:hypothetical protein
MDLVDITGGYNSVLEVNVGKIMAYNKKVARVYDSMRACVDKLAKLGVPASVALFSTVDNAIKMYGAERK